MLGKIFAQNQFPVYSNGFLKGYNPGMDNHKGEHSSCQYTVITIIFIFCSFVGLYYLKPKECIVVYIFTSM